VKSCEIKLRQRMKRKVWYQRERERERETSGVRIIDRIGQRCKVWCMSNLQVLIHH
jgi:hypothetical protein